MIVYMLQDVCTGKFYEGVYHGTSDWGPQSMGKIWTDLRHVNEVRYALKCVYTTIIREYRLEPVA